MTKSFRGYYEADQRYCLPVALIVQKAGGMVWTAAGGRRNDGRKHKRYWNIGFWLVRDESDVIDEKY